MNALLSAWTPSFRHGVHPHDHKQHTAQLPVQRMPFVEHYRLPLQQHLGTPARCVVQPGQRVTRGQLLAEPDGFISTALHSPVTGWIKGLQPQRHPNGRLLATICIDADPYATQQMTQQPVNQDKLLSSDAFVQHVQQAGLVGMGGAAFPSHVKYAPPPEKPIHHLVINGSECEPYLTADYRLMVERPEAIIRGTESLRRHLGADHATIGVEQNKPEAIRILREHLAPELPIEVVALKVKYPQGAERILLHTLLGVEMASGLLPLDLGIVVNNVATMAALADALDLGLPLIERVVTVAGPGIPQPANLRVPIGTSVRDVLAFCGGPSQDTTRIIMGGPMMGMPLSDLDTPILKSSAGLLVFTHDPIHTTREYACIRCGRCMDACPLFLNPSLLNRLAKAGRYRDVEQRHGLDCMECGSCTFACPSSIPIVQRVKMAKLHLRQSQG